MQTDEKKLIGEADAKQIAAWKEKHPLGVIFVKKAGRIAYFKQPGFKEIDAYYGSASKSKDSISDGWKTLAGLLYIGGDKELTESPLYLGTVAKRLQDAMAGEETELGNL